MSAIENINNQKNSVKTLTRSQKRILEAELLSMKNKGVGLSGKRKELISSNCIHIAKLETIETIAP